MRLLSQELRLLPILALACILTVGCSTRKAEMKLSTLSDNIIAQRFTNAASTRASLLNPKKGAQFLEETSLWLGGLSGASASEGRNEVIKWIAKTERTIVRARVGLAIAQGMQDVGRSMEQQRQARTEAQASARRNQQLQEIQNDLRRLKMCSSYGVCY